MKTISSAFLLLLVASAGSDPVPFVDGLVVRGDVQIAPGTYELTTPIRIVEHGSRLDLAGVVLRSPVAGGPAASFTDTAIIVQGLRGVTIANATIQGFKVGISGWGCTRLAITGCDLTGNYRQRLHSTPERENEADWLWPHHNDENQWATDYGAGIYLDGCRSAEIAGNVGHDSQNGIILSRTDSSFVYDNDMSYNSGWGLAMWRSCGNEVSNNRFDYCVRGYSHGIYRRGQDSAGILLFEQCCDNVFAFNSATHGGDGFFLYAGHETLEQTGLGGSNRNLVWGNDFSHAVANGIEATFSEGNRFIENILDECEYGVWAGYSYGTDIVGNRISRCARAGVAIEHGHDNRIEGNAFTGNRVGVLLWAFPNAQFDSSVYGQNQNTRSERYRILRNRFETDSTSVRLYTTSEVRIEENEFNPLDAVLTLKTFSPALTFRCNNVNGGRILARNEASEGVVLDANYAAVRAVEGDVSMPDTLPAPVPADSTALDPARFRPHTRGTLDAFIPAGGLRGRETMVIDDWGPIPAGALRLFPRDPAGWGDGRLFLAGRSGYFDVTLVTGPVFVEPLAGRVPSSLVVRPMRPGFAEANVQISCGERVFDTKVGLASSEWLVRFYGWEATASGEPPGDWAVVTARSPLDTLHTDRLDFWWGGKAPTERVPAEYFATVGETSVSIPGGFYTAHTISDDCIRVFVDGKSVVDNWTTHGPKEDRGSFTVATGMHRFRVEHCQLDGSSWLQFWIQK